MPTLWQKWFASKLPTEPFYNVAEMYNIFDTLGLSNKGQDLEKIAMLYTIILKRAEYCSQVEFKHVKGDKEIVDSKILKLLQTPNTYQSFKEFIYQYVFNLSFGTAYIENIVPVGFGIDKAQLLHLATKDLKVPEYGYKQFKNGDEIKDYVYDYGDGQETIPSDNILAFVDDTQKAKNFLQGTSKTKAGELIFTNSQLRLEADNVLTDKPGGIGVLSTSDKNTNGVPVPLNPKEKEALHNELKKHGVSKGKRHIILTAAALNYLPLSNPIKDWDLPKNTERDYILACNLFGIPKELMIKDATFENKQYAMLDYYSGDPLSTMQSFADKLMRYFKEEGELIASYDHVPVMQKKRKERAEYLNTFLAAMKLAQELGVDPQIIKDKIESEL